MDTIRKGQLSKELLENPLLQESLNAIESALVDTWKGSSDPKEREEVWYTLKGLKRFEGVLRVAVENSELDIALRDK